MNCPTCGRKIPGSDINIQKLVAHCRSCEEVFSFAEQFPGAEEKSVSEVARRMPPRPQQLTVREEGGRLVMSYPWRTGALMMMIPFTIAWDGFLVFWYAMALHVPGPVGVKLLMTVFPIAHVAAGIFLTHLCLSGLFNSTTITVDRNALTIAHGPIPAGGNVNLPVDDLDQLFCREHATTDSDGDTSRNFSLHAVLRNGVRRDLLVGQADRDMLRYLEYMIERHLDIKDRPVEGEMRRPR